MPKLGFGDLAIATRIKTGHGMLGTVVAVLPSTTAREVEIHVRWDESGHTYKYVLSELISAECQIVPTPKPPRTAREVVEFLTEVW